MANFGGPNDFYTSGDNSYNFDMPEFDQELNFQNFENTPTSVPPNFDLNYPNTNNSGMSSFYDPNAYAPNPYEQDDKGFKAGAGNTGNEFEDEPPLLEELGINPNHIFQKTLAVLNPMRGADQQILQNFENTPTSVPPNFDLNYPNTNNSGMSSFYDPNAYAPNPYEQDDKGFKAGAGNTGNEFEDEPPLLEELGINPNHIFQKTLAVLNPMRGADQQILQDTDMAGPLVFCLALGGFLLLSGKVTFSYIYGIGVMGSIAFYCLLSLMASQANVTFGAVVSVLGYCLLPMVVLSGVNVLITIQGTIGLIVAGVCIFWCSLSASKLFVTAYSMDHQQVLIAYPCALLYGVFALITIF